MFVRVGALKIIDVTIARRTSEIRIFKRQTRNFIAIRCLRQTGGSLLRTLEGHEVLTDPVQCNEIDG